MVYRLDRRLVFPAPELARADGLLAVGGDLSEERLMLAYANGIFPWYSEGMPILWHSPDPRFVLRPSELHVPRSLEKQLRRGAYSITYDERFEQVVRACQSRLRPEQDGTWITDAMVDAYCRLHTCGLAHSVEASCEGELVGGFYGVSLGGVFFGESMFSAARDASKVCFATFVRQASHWGIELVDCQVETEHTRRFGAQPWSRAHFLTELERLLERPTVRGPWRRPNAG